MKSTLLSMTQDILSSLSSDEVNSIGDTTESLQVANIIKQKYFDIINRTPLPEHVQLIQLDPSLDGSSPVLMYVPQGVAKIDWLQYFNSALVDGSNGSDHDINTDIVVTTEELAVSSPPGYQYVNIVPLKQFLSIVNSFNTLNTNVDTWVFSDTSNGFNSTYTLNFRTDRQPQYCTVISNFYVLFDSFDSTQDSTLQATKSMASGQVIPAFSMTDAYVPNLAEEQFQLLFNEAKALAFFELKQQPHQLAIQETKRGWTNVQKNKSVVDSPTSFDALPNYGRFGRGGWGVPSYFKQRGFDK